MIISVVLWEARLKSWLNCCNGHFTKILKEPYLHYFTHYSTSLLQPCNIFYFPQTLKGILVYCFGKFGDNSCLALNIYPSVSFWHSLMPHRFQECVRMIDSHCHVEVILGKATLPLFYSNLQIPVTNLRLFFVVWLKFPLYNQSFPIKGSMVANPFNSPYLLHT